jgi:LmbE family N-acetylglucosaminyl deacetylase
MSPLVGFMYAHPDDESFLSACLIRQIADRGGKAVLLAATKGDAGKTGLLGPLSKEELAARRVLELEAAGQILGLADIRHLGYPDGKLAEYVDSGLTDSVIAFLNEQNVQIVVTFAEDGGNRHPDHMAIHQATKTAIQSSRCPSVQKLYYHASPILEGYEPAYQVDTKEQWAVKAAALRAHESQSLVIANYFGDLHTCPANRRYEQFVLAWERNKEWPPKKESFIFDDLQLG